jgi:hypothetical protein
MYGSRNMYSEIIDNAKNNEKEMIIDITKYSYFVNTNLKLFLNLQE